MNIQELIITTAAEGEAMRVQRIRQAEAVARQKEQERKAELAEKWAPFIRDIKRNLPEWAWDYLGEPNSEPTGYDDTWYIRPLVLSLPDATPIAIWADEYDNVQFGAFDLKIGEDGIEYRLGENYRHYGRTVEHQNDDFPIALAEALKNEKRRPALEAQLEKRVAQAESVKPDIFQQLIADTLADRTLDDPHNMALATVGIVKELAAIRRLLDGHFNRD